MEKNWNVIAGITRGKGADLTVKVNGPAANIYQALGNAKETIAKTYPDFESIYIMSAVQDGKTNDNWKVYSRK